jgi:hypothetical protein
MHPQLVLGVMLAPFALFLGCGGDDQGVGPEPEEITGLWHATKAEYISRDVPPLRADVVALGGSVTMDFQAHDRFRYVETRAGGWSVTIDGNWNCDGDEMQCLPDGGYYWVFGVQLSNGTLSLTGGSNTYDFNGDGAPEPGTLDLVLIR